MFSSRSLSEFPPAEDLFNANAVNKEEEEEEEESLFKAKAVN
jgi:hypothetical protein